MIRRAHLADVDAIAKFNYNMAKETEGLELNLEILTKGVKALIEDEAKGVYYVYELDGRVVGQLMITKEWSDWRNGEFWWIQSVYVGSEYRKKGIFTQLYRYVEDIALREENVCGIRLYVEKENATAKVTYKSLSMSETHYDIYEMVKKSDWQR